MMYILLQNSLCIMYFFRPMNIQIYLENQSLMNISMNKYICVEILKYSNIFNYIWISYYIGILGMSVYIFLISMNQCLNVYVAKKIVIFFTNDYIFQEKNRNIFEYSPHTASKHHFLQSYTNRMYHNPFNFNKCLLNDFF